MRITFDPEADAAYIYVEDHLGFGEVAETHMCDVEVKEGAVILAFSEAGHLVGVEILGAAKLLSEDVLKTAERPGSGSTL
jgi:uncharacterized protein YuzE